jgi:hypothetical protein
MVKKMVLEEVQTLLFHFCREEMKNTFAKGREMDGDHWFTKQLDPSLDTFP